MNQLFITVPFLIGIAALLNGATAFILMKRGAEINTHLRSDALRIRRYTLFFLRKEYLHIAIVILVTGVFLFYLKKGEARYVVPAFLIGALCSGITGVVGAFTSTCANLYAASAARKSTREALKITLRGGSIVGFTLTGVSLISLSSLLYFFGGVFDFSSHSFQAQVMPILFGYALGAGVVALMGRINGGIFAKAADISADLVGKIEHDMDEDDPKNPAVLADMVGDNVNDITGMSFDLIESYVVAILGAMLVGASTGDPALTFLPLLLAGLGVLVSMGMPLMVRMTESGDPQRAILRGGVLVNVLLLLAGLPLIWLLVPGPEGYGAYGSYALGVVSGICISFFTGYTTSRVGKPVIGIAGAARGGVTPAVVEGLHLGTASVIVPVFLIFVVLFAVQGMSGLYGITLAALGLLSSTAMQAGVDASGPITDNAGALVMLGSFHPASRERTDKLDVMGNSLNAVGKMYAIISAAFISIVLFVVYTHVAKIRVIDLLEFHVLAGVFLGSAFPYLLTSYLLRGVNRVMYRMIVENRRIFDWGKPEEWNRDTAGLLKLGQKHSILFMYVASVITLLFPVMIWFVAGHAMLGGVLVGTTASGTMLAMTLNNAGGGWDNAKKHIESGAFGGRRTVAHRSAVISDSIGDPLKDLVGPSMDIVMKLIAVEAIILAGV